MKAQECLDLLQSSNVHDKLTALNWVKERDNSEFLEDILLLLQDDNREVRNNSFLILERASNSLDYSRLLNHSDIEVKKWVLWKMVCAKHTALLQELTDLCRKSENSLQPYCLWACIALGASRDLLIQSCYRGVSETKELACWALEKSKIYSKNVLQALVDVTNDSTVDINYPLSAISRFTCIDTEDCLIILKTQFLDLKKWVYGQLNQTDSDELFEVVHVLIKIFEHSQDSYERSCLLKLFFRISTIDRAQINRQKLGFLEKITEILSEESHYRSFLFSETTRIQNLLLKEIQKHPDISEKEILQFIQQHVNLHRQKDVLDLSSDSILEMEEVGFPKYTIPTPALVEDATPLLQKLFIAEAKAYQDSQNQQWQQQQAEWEKLEREEQLEWEQQQRHWQREQAEWQLQKNYSLTTELCAHCQTTICFPEEQGKFQCRACKNYLVRDSNTHKPYGIKNPNFEMSMPLENSYIPAVLDAVDGFCRQLDFNNLFAEELCQALEKILFSISKQKQSLERIRIVGTGDKKEIVLGIFTTQQQVVIEEDSTSPLINQLETFALENQGLLFKVTKKRN